MLIVRLKKKEEFEKVCQGKAVFFSENNGCIHYYTPTRVNEIEMIYAFDSRTAIPFREHYDLEDEEGTHVWQLIEINGLCFFDTPDGMVPPEILFSEEQARVY